MYMYMYTHMYTHPLFAGQRHVLWDFLVSEVGRSLNPQAAWAEFGGSPSTSKRSARWFARHWLVLDGVWLWPDGCFIFSILGWICTWNASDLFYLTKIFYPRYPLTRWKLVSVDPPILLCCRTSDPTQARSELQRDCCNLRMYGSAFAAHLWFKEDDQHGFPRVQP